MGPEPEELALVVPDSAAGDRLDHFLVREHPGNTRSRFQRLIGMGLVTIDGITAPKSGIALRTGQEVVCSLPPADPTAAQPEQLPLDIIFEDGDLVVLNKAAGMVVHPAPGHASGTVVNALLHHFPDLGGGLRPGIVHRLDRSTSGLLVVARSERARQSLAAQFLDRTVFKGYLAVVAGRPGSSGEITSPIERHANDRKRFTSRSGEGRTAITRWRTVAAGTRWAVLAVRILTGRTHQIRVHLTDQGWPVLGDSLYSPSWERQASPLPTGWRQSCADGPLLHAAAIAFAHPADGHPVSFAAPLPPRFAPVLRELPAAAAQLLAATAWTPRFFDGEQP